MLRVLVADDHQMVREGRGRLLHRVDDIELVASETDGQDAACQVGYVLEDGKPAALMDTIRERAAAASSP